MAAKKSYELASRKHKSENTIVNVGGIEFGGNDISVIAGPCAVESEEQIFTIAEYVSNLGIGMIRGGAYKPRTSPYSFQGLGLEGLKLLDQVRKKFNLKVVTEVLGSKLLDQVCQYADVLQVGSRNMKNYQFLKELGQTRKPILLKRGMSATIDEWLMAAEYIMLGGNDQIILCERGIRTFDTSVRNTMDISSIPQIKALSHLPVIADPSQGSGFRHLVNPMSRASIAAGADGLMIETHHQPENALSDGFQSVYLEQLKEILNDCKSIADAVGKRLAFNTSQKITELS